MKAQIESITLDNLPDLPLNMDTAFDRTGLRRHLVTFPDVSWLIKDTEEYLIGSYWRGRKEIGMIMETVAGENRTILLETAVENFRRMGSTAVVLAHSEADNNYNFYSRLGWHHFDEITTYERNNCALSHHPPQRLDIQPFAINQLAQLIELEVSAFPWLWLSDPEDFIRYSNSYGVNVLTAWEGKDIVGYLGMTVSGFRGHLDRLAVHPKYQSKGYGEELLAYSLSWFAKQHVRRINLNTQISNYRSQALYRKYGFRLTGESHAVLGLRLQSPSHHHSGDPFAV